MEWLAMDWLMNPETGLLVQNKWVATVVFLTAVSSYVAAMFPSVMNNELYNVVMKLINWMGANKGKAKNAEDSVLVPKDLKKAA